MAKTGKDFLEEQFGRDDVHRLFLRAMEDFMPAFYADDSENQAMMKLLRAWLMPIQGKKYCHTGQIGFDLYDPSPENSFERAVSGLLSFHWSPMDEYFRLEDRRKQFGDLEKVSADTERHLGQRTDEIHSVIQEPANFQCMAVNARDKLGLGLAGREIEDDPDILARFLPIPPEDLAVASSDGRMLDIYGKREEINTFQMRRRFPKPVKPGYWDEKYPSKPLAEEKKKIFRFNFPYEVFRHVIEDQVKKVDAVSDKDFKRIMRELFGNPSEEERRGMWVDIWWTDDCILAINNDFFRRIIISSMSPPYRIMDMSRGQGEKAMPLMLQISELTVTGHSAFEKTMAPSWCVENDMARLGLDLGRDGISYKDRGMDKPEPLSLKADIQSAIAFPQYKQAQLDRIFYLDVFELLNKSRMTSTEVNIRDLDDFRKLGLYVVQDQFDDLNPTVLAINRQIHNQLEEKDQLAQRLLNARYTSALAFASKSNVFIKYNKILEIMERTAKVMESGTELTDDVDLGNYLKGTVVKIGEEKLLRGEDESKSRKKQREAQSRLAVQTEQACLLYTSPSPRD